MLQNGQISLKQLTVLVVLATIGDSILVLPAIPAHEARQDAWIVAIFSVIVGTLLGILYHAVGKLHPDLTVIGYSEEILGKWTGMVVSLLFLGYCFINSAAYLREIGDFITIHILPQTPLEAIHITFLLIVLMGVRLGLEPIARTAEIFFPWVIILTLFLVIALLPQAQIHNVQPILEGGVKPILRGSVTFISYPFMELVIVLMVLPYVNTDERKKVRNSLIAGVALGGLVLFLVTTLAILVLGVDLTARHLYPSYILAKKINIGEFIRRVEVILGIIWFLTIFFKFILYVYGLSIGLAQLLRLKEYRALTLPLGMILVPLSLLISPNISYLFTVERLYWPFFNATYSVLLPFLLICAAVLRRKRKKIEGEEQQG
ncbi:GerAB/ArcD/ProY family transporter [Brevibacillus massiliensis]|jgi:spore germination protein KB|nr:endospore germination permease [Brevibacillus massiliensis]